VLPLALLLLAALSSAQTAVQGPDAEEKSAAVRAALVYKFASYVAPDAGETTPARKEYRIGLLGTDQTAVTAQNILVGKKVGEAKVVVVVVDENDAVAGRAAEQCDLLYIAASCADEAVAKVVAAGAEKPLAMVSMRPGFAAAGGTIQLFVQDGGTRFEVNIDALRRQQLRASPQLLKHSQKGPAR